VKVISVDRERKRIGLSIRQLQQDPWLQKVGNLKEGMLIEGTITHLTKFGAFARIGDDLEGLIHVSELSEQRVNHPKEVVREGDVVTLRIIKVDPERRRIGLSRRKVDSPAYADLDWKMELADEVGKVQSEDEPVETPASEDELVEAQVSDEKPVEAPVMEAEPVEAPVMEAEPSKAPETKKKRKS
jgi:small subunit ribosomal protein S1